MDVVTISATYGAGGGLVGPAVAERLGVPFVDRAIPVEVANDLGIAVDDVLCRDEQVRGWMSRLLSATAPLSAEWIVDPHHLRTTMLSDGQVLRCTEGAIRRAVDAGGGVILGRAAAIVLRDHPRAFHVRLDGDPDLRLRQAVEVRRRPRARGARGPRAQRQGPRRLRPALLRRRPGERGALPPRPRQHAHRRSTRASRSSCPRRRPARGADEPAGSGPRQRIFTRPGRRRSVPPADVGAGRRGGRRTEARRAPRGRRSERRGPRADPAGPDHHPPRRGLREVRLRPLHGGGAVGADGRRRPDLPDRARPQAGRGGDQGAARADAERRPHRHPLGHRPRRRRRAHLHRPGHAGRAPDRLHEPDPAPRRRVRAATPTRSSACRSPTTRWARPRWTTSGPTATARSCSTPTARPAR